MTSDKQSESDLKHGVTVANPYRSSLLPAVDQGLDYPLDDDGRPLTSRGFAHIRRGSLVTLFGIFVPTLFITIVTVASMLSGRYSLDELLAFPRVPRLLLLLMVLFAGAAIPYGVVLCNQVRGRHRALGWLGTLLFYVGGGGTTGVLFRILSNGQLFGLTPLFAASTFSAFLTSLALFAMFFRTWSEKCNSPVASRAFEISVLMQAIAGVSATLAVLSPAILHLVVFGDRIGTLGLVVIPACWTFAYALYRLQRDWRRAETAGEPGSHAVET